jgi:hypothetical protein
MSKFKHIILAVAISVVLVFFIGFGIASFYPVPKYEDFCGEAKIADYSSQELCESANGKWTQTDFARPIPEKLESNQLLCTKLSEKDNALTLNCESREQILNTGYCDIDFYCREGYQDTSEKYNRNVFIIATGIGIIALIVGVALNLASVSAGLMGGGILSIIYGTIRYWSDLPDYGRFIILGITLVILIWLGYKRIKK